MIGKLPQPVLDALLETVPIEFSVLDKDDKVLAWNKHKTRVFKRPEAALGKDVRNCHPRKSLDKVEKIIAEMKEGTRDTAKFWIDLPLGDNDEMHKILIQYFVLRDPIGIYLGCMEVSQDITDLQKLKGQKRLLD